jgi:hypothetical protein
MSLPERECQNTKLPSVTGTPDLMSLAAGRPLSWTPDITRERGGSRKMNNQPNDG